MHYMGPTHFYGAGAEKPLQKADFAIKQTNICRLSGDIITFLLVWSTKQKFASHAIVLTEF